MRSQDLVKYTILNRARLCNTLVIYGKLQSREINTNFSGGRRALLWKMIEVKREEMRGMENKVKAIVPQTLPKWKSQGSPHLRACKVNLSLNTYM